MFCRNCGNTLPDDAKFCGSCGTKMEAQPPAPAQYTQPVYAPPMQVPPPRPQAYAPPPAWPAATMQPGDAAPLSVGQYIGMFLLMSIPLLNAILLLVWGFGSSANLNKRNFARAVLLMSLIALGVWVIVGALGLSSGILSELLSGMDAF